MRFSQSSMSKGPPEARMRAATPRAIQGAMSARLRTPTAVAMTSQEAISATAPSLPAATARTGATRFSVAPSLPTERTV